jgi:RNA polymerase primary sigma factor
MNNPHDYDSPPALQRLLDHPVLSEEEEIKLGRRARKGDEEALQTLVRCNLKLVVKFARDYYRPGGRIPFDDLFSAGVDGLINVARRYNPQKNRPARFATYARWYIRQAMQKHLRQFGHGAFRLSNAAAERIRCFAKARDELIQKLDREPTIDELAWEMGLPAWKVASTKNLWAGAVQLDAPTAGGETSVMDHIPAAPQAAPADILGAEEDRRLLDQLLAGIDPRDRQILEARFGLNGRPETLEALGRRFKVTRERIRQIEFLALRRLRARARNREAAAARLAA